MALHLYCPHCSGPVQRYVGIIYIRRGYFLETESRHTEYAACGACTLVSEVDRKTGMLMDLGDIRLADMLEPYGEPIMMIISPPSSLLGRADS